MANITGIDGIDHLNIYSKAKTPLGRWLSNFAHSPIDLPKDGHFESVEGYWYWLASRDERLRRATSFQAKQIGRAARLQRRPLLHIPDFEERIKKAIDVKLKSNLAMLKELALSTLPLVHYYEYGKPPVRKDGGYHWIVEHIESRRALLKEKGYANV